MTSTASQQNPVPAQNSSASTATSYASAAGATKKPTSTPLSAVGSNPPPVVVGSSAPGTQQLTQPQHGKPSSASPVNGRPAITPALPTVSAVPAIAHGTATNGHDRKGSLTMGSNGPNSYTPNGGPVGGPKGNIQFGYTSDSPAVAHSTPQPASSAPIPIPGNNSGRVPSPAASPSPIPQPSASGGRPPSMMAQDGGPNMKFGSLGGDGERHMKHLSQQGPHGGMAPSPHMRQGSTHSVHENMGGHNHGSHGSHGGQGPTRGGFGGGRGRGNYNNAGNYNAAMGGYPPGSQYGHNHAHNRGGGRGGGMPSYQNPRNMAPYQSAPQPRGSPAMGVAMPNPGTPTMNQSVPVHPPQPGFNAYMPPYQNVNDYSHQSHEPQEPLLKSAKKKTARRNSVKMTQRQHLPSFSPLESQSPTHSSFISHEENGLAYGRVRPQGRGSGFMHMNGNSNGHGNGHGRVNGNARDRRESGARWDASTYSNPRGNAPANHNGHSFGNGNSNSNNVSGRRPSKSSGQQRVPFQSPVVPDASQPFRSTPAPVNNILSLDAAAGDKINLSPTSGNFDRLLTFKKQTYPFPGAPYDPRQGAIMGMGPPYYPQMPTMQYMPGPGPSPQPGFQQPYTQPPYPQAPAAQPMSRNPSGMSTSVERPNSSTGHPQPPAPVQGSTPIVHSATAKPAVVSSGSSFVLPKKKAITIKNPQGEALDLASLKAPASPAPSITQSKTPPVVGSSPTPPPLKPGTPSSHGHGRSDSSATSKTAEQLRNEFKEQVRKTAEAPSSDVKEPAAAAEEATAKPAEEPAAEVVDAKSTEAKGTPEEPKARDVTTEIKVEPATPATPTPVATHSAASASVPAPAEKDEAKSTEETKPADVKNDEKPAEAPKPEEDEEAAMERMIREMEEADAAREKQEAEFAAKKKAATEAQKKQDEENRLKNAADNDRKLQEQEREMERLEEERERKRNEAAAKGAKSVAEALAEASSDSTLKPAEEKEKEAATPTPGSVADKLASLSIRSSSPSAASVAPGPKSGGSEKLRTKPAALNLAPLNTKPVEPPQPSAALQSLKSARFLDVISQSVYPPGINSPNPALNQAVQRKGKSFKYDTSFLLQFQKVFTEQPSMDFGQQVKSLIGDGDRSASVRTPASSGRQGSRAGGAAGGFGGAMGSFGASGGGPGGSKLPPGTTSAQRFEMSNRPGGAMGSMGSFPRPFPGAAQMTRTPSSSNMGGPGGMPNSPRQGSRSTRGGSKRDYTNAKNEAQAAKSMPLTQGMELKPITVSATGWKPSSVGNRGGAAAAAAAAAAGAQSGHMDPEMVQRKVKAALNKMTPEKFDKIADQILSIAAQSKDEQDGRTLRQVIQLTFEKATDEAHWASMYAKFCKRMLDTMSPEIRDVSIHDKHGQVVGGGALFRKYLLNRCQEDFERGWKVDLPESKKEESEGEKKPAPGDAEMLSDEYYIAAAAKRRGLGLVQFIGELYKLGMLTERIMHQCVQKLVDYRTVPDEQEIESLCKLLRTIGGNLDVNTEKTQGKNFMDAYFQRIQKTSELPELPSRLKFMLMDIIDLRKAGWISKEANKGPKTLDEVRAEAEAQAAQKAAENARSNQRGPPGGRPQLGGRGGDGRGLSGYGQPAANQNQIGMDDLRRLQRSATRTTSQNATFGPSSMFTSRSNSGRARIGAGGSFNRAGEDSNASSRTGTPPTRESTNAYSLLANMETENPASPPSTAASPALSKAVPDTSAAKGRD